MLSGVSTAQRMYTPHGFMATESSKTVGNNYPQQHEYNSNSRVNVENITQGTSLTLNGDDILNLTDLKIYLSFINSERLRLVFFVQTLTNISYYQKDTK